MLGQKTGSEYIIYMYDENGSAYGLLIKNGTTEEYYYYIYNAPGDVIGIIDESGTQVVEYDYDAWGKVLSVTGTSASTIGQINPIRYRGYYFDSETGFYYLQSRYYDPKIGRFINSDAILGANQDILGYNLFAYCSNDPVNMQDSTGFRAVENDHRGAWVMVTNNRNLIIYDGKKATITTVTTAVTVKKPAKGINAESIQEAFNSSARGGDFDGVYGLQCVDFSNWFVSTYTTLKTTSGNGKDIAVNLASKNGLPAPSSTPIAIAIYSVDAGVRAFGASGGKYGHTGVVLSVDEVKHTVTVIHTWNGLSGPNSRISTYSYPVNGVTFTYIGDYLR